MRALAVRGWAAALVMGMAAPLALAADDDEGPKPRKSWVPSFNWFGKKKVEVREAGPQDEPAAQPPPPEALAAARREREENAYFRRLAVCDLLEEIALQADDADLQRQVQQLKERAWTVYQQNTAARPAGGRFADEAVLSQRLGSDGAGKRLLEERGGSKGAGARADTRRDK